MTKTCDTCGIDIPKGRLDALPSTTTCVKCSRVRSPIGFMDWYHKTAPEIVMVSASDTESLRRAERCNRRAR